MFIICLVVELVRAFMLAHVIADIITGDIVEPEIAVNVSPSVGGLLDSLTGSIGISGISTRGKPAPASVAASPASLASLTGSVMSDAQKAGSRPLDKDALQSFISSSMPFGWYYGCYTSLKCLMMDVHTILITLSF